MWELPEVPASVFFFLCVFYLFLFLQLQLCFLFGLREQRKAKISNKGWMQHSAECRRSLSCQLLDTGLMEKRPSHLFHFLPLAFLFAPLFSPPVRCRVLTLRLFICFNGHLWTCGGGVVVSSNEPRPVAFSHRPQMWRQIYFDGRNEWVRQCMCWIFDLHC